MHIKKQIQLDHHEILMSVNSINGIKIQYNTIQYKVNMELINITEQSINQLLFININKCSLVNVL